ncbi:cutinase family protein [Nonomuraea sp. NPDC050394]|uniref:cutinase family protein n=1 Tax=Nonomuraea sp. NPDC050394 TaxID=3364363 RepID=UPI0037A55938
MKSILRLLAAAATVALLLPMGPAHASAGPDLTPTAITFSGGAIRTGHSVQFDSGIRNLGDQAASVFNIKWYVDGQEVGAYGSHAGVAGKTTVMNGNSQFAWKFGEPGSHSVRFTVDADDHISETDERNNSRTVTVRVTGTPGPGKPKSCSKIVFIGLRGSGERAFELQHDMGATIYRGVFEEFRSRANSANVKVDGVGFSGVSYPADSVDVLLAKGLVRRQFESVDRGVEGLAHHMDAAVKGNACIALAGYSQGAWVIGAYLAKHPKHKKKITAIVLFGDPRFSPKPPVARGSLEHPGSLRAFGVDKGHYYEDMRDRVRSYCQKGDPVCSFTTARVPSCNPLALGFLQTCAHTHYIAGVLAHGYTEDGTAFLAKKLLGQNA